VVAVAIAAALYAGGTFVAPLLVAQGSSWGGLLHLSYAPVCHQQAERSLAVGQGFQSVCARCSGLYLGGVAGLIVGVLFLVGRREAPRPIWLGLMALPTIVDALLPWIGLPGAANEPRFLLAWPLGFTAALYVARGIEEIVAPRAAPRRRDSDREQTANWTACRAGRESVEVADG
jgi:uncharacterized membrane protein